MKKNILSTVIGERCLATRIPEAMAQNPRYLSKEKGQ